MNKKLFLNIVFVVTMFNVATYSQDCDAGFTFIALEDIPVNVWSSLNECFSDTDLAVLNDIIDLNELDEYESPLQVGNQTWSSGRLTTLIAPYQPNGLDGVYKQLEVLPDSFGNLTSLAHMEFYENKLTALPASITQLSNLLYVILNNNYIASLPDDIGTLSNLWVLDLGFNYITEIPESLCDLSNLEYFWISSNQLASVPLCICDLQIDWSGESNYSQDWTPFFIIGGNLLCDDVPFCIENSVHFEIGMDPDYYAFPIDAPQICCPDLAVGDVSGDTVLNVLDIVILTNCILTGSCNDIENGCAGDLNSDDVFNVLDVVILANCILSPDCG